MKDRKSVQLDVDGGGRKTVILSEQPEISQPMQTSATALDETTRER
jgi:hypothetical protein